MTREEAIASVGRHCKAAKPPSPIYCYGKVIEVAGHGRYVRIKVGQSDAYHPRWFACEHVELHPLEGTP